MIAKGRLNSYSCTKVKNFAIIPPCWGLSLLLIFIALVNHAHAFPTTQKPFVGRKNEKIFPKSMFLPASSDRILMDNINDVSPPSNTLAPTSAPLDWEFLDAVYLIHCPNGDSDGTRIKLTENILGKVNLLDRVTIKEFETDDEDRVRGCYTSHVSIFRDIIEKDSRRSPTGFKFLDVFQKGNDPPNNNDDLNVLIFEDNVDLGNKLLMQNTVDVISNFIQNNENQWDIIHLAYIPYVPDLKISKTDDKGIVKLSTSNKQSALGTTAYIINSRAMKRIIQEDDKNGYTVSIPDMMADLFGQSRFALNPTAFIRAPATKSLVNPQLDDLRSILFRPSVVAVVQQILVITGLSTTVLLPLVILVLVMTSIISANSTVHTVLEFSSSGTLDGPILFPMINALLSVFSLGLIIQGILLAPAPDDPNNDQKQ